MDASSAWQSAPDGRDTIATSPIAFAAFAASAASAAPADVGGSVGDGSCDSHATPSSASTRSACALRVSH